MLCVYCDNGYKMKDLNKHEMWCGSRTTKCEQCNALIVISSLLFISGKLILIRIQTAQMLKCNKQF